ncbi:uncharacterized protein [Rutidosis leptorrhynchoides]|uniref:uncharacterized protein n=1 Tax=Rutidosis leptorrhynchoides TaxID=125765 RepID=UPI003A99D544
MVEKLGGQIFIWDKNELDVTNSYVSDFCTGIRGSMVWSGDNFNIVNVCGPHDDVNKQRMWDFLHVSVMSNANDAWVICGDFNEVRVEDERLNCNFIERRAKKFNELIYKAKLIDIPLGGRKYTRISDDGLKFRKLDRFLVNDDDVKNFGSKPIKVFADWLDVEGVDQVIKEAWESDGGNGPRLDCRLRNKMKKTKFALNEKSQEKFSNLDGEIDAFKGIANALELKAESGVINDKERIQWLSNRKEWLQ